MSYARKPKWTNGFGIFLNPDDLSAVSSSIATFGWLNLSVTSLLAKLVHPSMTVVDVGANIGYYTLLMAKLVGKSGLVLSFEPEPTNFAYLGRSIKLNEFSHVKAFQTALSDREGHIYLHLSRTDPTAHSIERDSGGGRLAVEGSTLDSACHSTAVDLVKIHSSGSEARILRGAQELIERQRPKLLTVYTKREWRGEDELLENLFHRYDVFEVVSTPFLIRRISKSKLMRQGAAEIYFRPA